MICALIVAAGQGLRMGTPQRKQYLHLGDRPILTRTLQAFDRVERIDQIVLAVAPSEKTYCENEILACANLNKGVVMVEGGAHRQASVFNGLQWLGDAEGIVLIHDGVRPMVTNALIDACIEGALHWDACIPAVPVVDTPKQIGAGGIIVRTLEREHLQMAQTPQAFRLPLIYRAHAEARRFGLKATDDASLVESMGRAVHVVAGLRENIKITTPEDLAWAEAWLRSSGQL
jgi:2-C-methyl-D-erythritol 4-phosphate cytidylyltransferase